MGEHNLIPIYSPIFILFYISLNPRGLPGLFTVFTKHLLPSKGMSHALSSKASCLCFPTSFLFDCPCFPIPFLDPHFDSRLPLRYSSCPSPTPSIGSIIFIPVFRRIVVSGTPQHLSDLIALLEIRGLKIRLYQKLNSKSSCGLPS